MERVPPVQTLKSHPRVNEGPHSKSNIKHVVVHSDVPFHDSFYATVCHTCKEHRVDSTGHTLLKVCKSCKLVSYCCVEHQKEHWRLHKSFCHAIQNILKKMGISKLFDQSMRLLPAKEWNSIRFQILLACEIELNHSLSLSEKQMIMFPRVCNVCHDACSEYLFDCENCRCVSYCSFEHSKADKKRHTEDCSALKQGFDLNLLMFQAQGKVPHFPVITSVNPSEHDESSLQTLKRLAAEHSIQSVIYSEMLTCPMTIVYVAHKLDLLNIQKLTIHIVGVSTLESVYFAAWENIFHWLTNVKTLEILMIGPEEKGTLSIPNLCERCVDRQNVLSWSVSAGCYTESVVNTASAINMIVAFNCGFGEFAGSDRDTWAASIPVMLETGAPIVFTSYTHDEAINDMKALQQACGSVANVLAFGEKNIFCSQYPHRDWECDEENKSSQVFFKNNYLSIVRK